MPAHPRRFPIAILLLVAAHAAAGEALWHYRVPVPRGPDRAGKAQEPGAALCWLPPAAPRLRGLFLCGQLGIEGELVADDQVRAACAENAIAIVYFRPHLSGTFTFWQPGNQDGPRLLAALDALAARTGHGELRRVPWITAGHSTAGIFCRNVACWQPQRVAAVVHLKSGNFHQASVKPPLGGLAGIPLVAVNGQFETFGPEAGIQPELGRETQWIHAQKDLQRFRAADAEHLMQMLVQPGDDHFHGSPELGAFVAAFVRATARHRLAAELPPGDAAVPCLAVKAADGWLSDPDLRAPKHPAAPFAAYAGDRAAAMWHYDEAIAAATAAWHRNLARHQCLDNPAGTWLEDGDGWTVKVAARWLDAMPEKIGGSLGNAAVGHAATPFTLRCKPTEPVVQLGPDTFRVLRPVKSIAIAAYHPGDERFRATVRWGGIEVPPVKAGQEQRIEFPSPGDVPADGPPRPLAAKASSGLPVTYEVEYGPVRVVEGKLSVAELPAGAVLPMECRVVAHQLGRRTGGAVKPAAAVGVEFKVVGR